MATLVQPLLSDVLTQREERRRSIDSALGTTLAEGVSPGPEVLALAERYVEGELTLEQFGSAVRSRWGI